MAGLIAIGVLVIWLVIVAAITSKVAARVSARWRWLFGPVFFCALLVLPVVDEIIGGFQFRALCKENASEFRLGVKDPQGRTTKLTINPSNRYIAGTAIPIRHSHYEYHDIATGELVMAYDRYVAGSGLLISAIGMGSDTDSCSPERDQTAHITMKFNVVD